VFSERSEDLRRRCRNMKDLFVWAEQKCSFTLLNLLQRSFRTL